LAPWNYLEIVASVLYFSRVHLHNWNMPSAYTDMFWGRLDGVLSSVCWVSQRL